MLKIKDSVLRLNMTLQILRTFSANVHRVWYQIVF